MARRFDTNTDDLTDTSLSEAPPGAAGSIALWFRPDWDWNDGVYHTMFSFYNGFGSGTRHLEFNKESGNYISAGWVHDNTAEYRVFINPPTGMFQNGTWAHWCLTWNDTSNVTTLYRNGTSVGTNNVLTTAALTGGTVGNFRPSSTGQDRSCMGNMQDFGMWSTDLSADEIAALAKGFACPLVRPGALEIYLPMNTLATDERNLYGVDVYTASGTVFADNRSIFYPQAPFYPPAVAAVVPPAVTYAPANVIWF